MVNSGFPGARVPSSHLFNNGSCSYTFHILVFSRSSLGGQIISGAWKITKSSLYRPDEVRVAVENAYFGSSRMIIYADSVVATTTYDALAVRLNACDALLVANQRLHDRAIRQAP